MKESELEALLQETLGAPALPPREVNARVHLALTARRERKSISLWWVPLACSLAMGLFLCLLGGLLPWPLEHLCRLTGLGSAAAAAVLTAVGLAKFDLREKGRVFL